MELRTVPGPNFRGTLLFKGGEMVLLTLDLITARQKGKKFRFRVKANQ